LDLSQSFTAVATLLSPDFNPRVCASFGSPGDPPHMRIQWRQHVRSAHNELIFWALEEINEVMTDPFRESPWHADPWIGSISVITGIQSISSEIFESALSIPYQLELSLNVYLEIYCYLISSLQMALAGFPFLSTLMHFLPLDIADICAPLGLSGSYCICPIPSCM
jgi:hypothetical protein